MLTDGGPGWVYAQGGTGWSVEYQQGGKAVEW